MAIENPTCGQSNGSIKKIQIDKPGSKVFCTWRDATNKVVGTALDLPDIPAGVYTLEVSDNSGCRTPVPLLTVTVENKNAVTITGTPHIKIASCQNDGAITGLTVTGATLYQWRNSLTGNVVTTTTSDLLNVPAGSYILKASNASCSASSETYTIAPAVDPPRVSKVRIIQPTCKNYGSDSIIVGLTLNPNHPPLKYFFADANGVGVNEGYLFTDILFTFAKVGGLQAGKYGLFVANTDGSCPTQLGSYTINDAVINIYPDSSQIFNDHCNQHIGAIQPFIVGLPPATPVKYIWTNLQTNKVVSKFKLLERASAGQYLFEVFASCGASAIFTVTNDSPALTPPIADGTTLCLPGTVLIKVQNPDTAGVFKLYASLTDSVAIATSAQGVFVQHVSQTTDFYVARKHGDCESERTKVTEVVVANVNIPNAFTPNHDGTNDYWGISGLEKFPGADVSVFSRSGALLFHSINYATPFSGQYKGKDLPAGVYYYVIDVKKPICFGKIAGSLTIIR